MINWFRDDVTLARTDVSGYVHVVDIHIESSMQPALWKSVLQLHTDGRGFIDVPTLVLVRDMGGQPTCPNTDEGVDA